MNEDTRTQAKERLQAAREDTLDEISHLREALKYELEYDLEEGDPDLYEREKILALLRTQEEKLDAIAYALGLIDEGSYGICENCGREINAERLEALPHTTLCIECKALVEKRVIARPADQLAR